MAVDLELKKAFQEQQIRMIETTQQLKIADMQVEQLKRKQQHCRLTAAELGALPGETRVFEGVGRMFLLQDMEGIQSVLASRVNEAEKQVQKVQSNKTYLERTLKDSESNLRELVASKRAAKP
ncbi:prefoldin subunit 1 [Strongylocentrotus purpuratus]|uniref:Prefoldin subunit 1 n=1 Tax=Strongylocentrotus purpuratus TaxID=7668 RepID=A0A7M7NEA2_STRPU|nr:prefoldin subunit 1-like [Strongylocentrotus purpuratus]XP_781962.1 prefoldin subunit 1 [Strongylocentrotus purpuratus]|eukprot:XP_781962.1 PREDICTED: prefoldin subunit 1 [Strongylocentrotus purpuratus]